jgi:hypothetical protein
MGILIFFKKSDFHLSNGIFPIFCYEISAAALAGRFCVARGTCVERVTEKYRLSRCLFPLCTISSLCLGCARVNWNHFTTFEMKWLMCRLIKCSNDASQQITTLLYIKRACELNKSHIISTDTDEVYTRCVT